MIEERINNSLKELEQGLKDIDSARKQVEKTVNSYEGLNNSTIEYVNKLTGLTSTVDSLISAIDTDHRQRITELENDRKAIVRSVNAATKKLEDTTESVQSSLYIIENKLKYSLILNVITIFVLLGFIIWSLGN